MLRPVSLGVDWSAPVSAADAFDPQWSGASNYAWPGVYLHVVRGAGGHVIASYVGKHTQSVIDRQSEHLINLLAGDYHLFDRSGHRTFTRGAAPGPEFFDRVEEYIEITEVSFGKITGAPIGPSAHWIAAVESLIQRSPAWIAAAGIVLNHRMEPALYQMHDRFVIQHSGSLAALAMLGPTTSWDRAAKAVR